MKGIGVEKDNKRGIELLQQAAQKGFIQALKDLSFSYKNGSYGLPNDIARSNALLKLVAKKG